MPKNPKASDKEQTSAASAADITKMHLEFSYEVLKSPEKAKCYADILHFAYKYGRSHSMDEYLHNNTLEVCRTGEWVSIDSDYS